MQGIYVQMSNTLSWSWAIPRENVMSSVRYASRVRTRQVAMNPVKNEWAPSILAGVILTLTKVQICPTMGFRSSRSSK